MQNIRAEKNIKRQNARLWLMFIDYAKAFDTVHHDALWTTLKEFGIPPHLIWLLKRLYDETNGVIRDVCWQRSYSSILL